MTTWPATIAARKTADRRRQERWVVEAEAVLAETDRLLAGH